MNEIKNTYDCLRNLVDIRTLIMMKEPIYQLKYTHDFEDKEYKFLLDEICIISKIVNYLLDFYYSVFDKNSYDKYAVLSDDEENELNKIIKYVYCKDLLNEIDRLNENIINLKLSKETKK